MISFLDAPDHVIACRMTGEVKGDDYDTLASALDAALERHPRISLYVEVSDVLHMTGEAVLKDIGYGLEQIRYLNRFYRAALVTDVEWLRTLAKWENRVVPFVHVRAFPLAEREAAQAWAAELPDASAPGLVRLATTKPDVFAYAIRDTLSAQDVEGLIPEMNAAFEAHDKVDLLVRIESYPAIPWDAFSRDLVRTKVNALRNVRRYAIVGGPGWMSGIVSFLDPLFKAEIRTFDRSEEAQAWDWLGARPADEADARA